MMPYFAVLLKRIIIIKITQIICLLRSQGDNQRKVGWSPARKHHITTTVLFYQIQF